MTNAAQARRKADVSTDRKIHLFVLIDALGWEYIKGRAFLNEILLHRQPLRTVLGFSSGAIPTILTGEWPSVTGHWNLFYYDPQGSPFWWLKYFQFLPDLVMNSRVAGKVLKETGKRLFALGSGFDCGVKPRFLRWFNWVERRNIYEVGGIARARSIFDYLASNGIPHRVYTYHKWKDGEAIEQAKVDITTNAANYFFLYLSEMDMFLHEHCIHEDQICQKLAWYEEQIRRLYQHARLYAESVSLTVFSDHGMTPVTSHYDLMRDVESTGYRCPGDYLAVYDSTMARFWFFSDSARAGITKALETAPCGRILSQEELKSMGVWFEDQRFGEVIYLLNSGCMLAKSDFNGPRWMPCGMHGYHPDDRYSSGVFLSDVPPSHNIRHIADVYRCMVEATR